MGLFRHHDRAGEGLLRGTGMLQNRLEEGQPCGGRTHLMFLPGFWPKQLLGEEHGWPWQVGLVFMVCG